MNSRQRFYESASFGVGTNYCHIFVSCVKDKIVVFSAIDNLVKGASGQAIQNMNIIFGLEETLGLK